MWVPWILLLECCWCIGALFFLLKPWSGVSGGDGDNDDE
jgi:hypothetical protein